ncbi:MAG TPA: arginine deiminase-related protein [Actinomycetota bacterium]|nr:arginine deiminase-related protein [Actinomycetota bacterium]
MHLSWGRRYLMCPPSHFGILYEINPWMHREVAADPDRTRTQWEDLVRTIRAAGATVETIEAVEGLPDMVFTANGGLVDGGRFLLSRFAHPERAGEEPQFKRWFESAGSEVVELPPGQRFEGAGDALPFAGRLVAGYRIRSDFLAHTTVARELGVEVLSLELTDERFYHVDLTFCPLTDRHAIVAPVAWDRYGLEVVRRLVPEPIVLEPDEARTFCANSVVVGDRIVMPACPVRVGRELERLGFAVEVSPVDEFLKAGGGVRCLTLALDVTLSG